MSNSNSRSTGNVSGIVGGKYGVGLFGYAFEVRESLVTDVFSYRGSVSLYGIRGRVTSDLDGNITIDLGLGGTLGIGGKGVSGIIGGRYNKDGLGLVMGGSFVASPTGVPVGGGLSGDYTFRGPNDPANSEPLSFLGLAGGNPTDVRGTGLQRGPNNSGYGDALSRNPGSTPSIGLTRQELDDIVITLGPLARTTFAPLQLTYDDPSIGSFGGGFFGGLGGFGGFSYSAGTRAAEEGLNDDVSSNAGGGGDPKPIVIDLDGDGVELLTMDESFVLFDWDDDGFAERSAWVGRDDGLLMFDENNDGLITTAREIAFAQWTEADDTDMEALAATFDSNGDGKLNQLDADFASFKIWQDINSNGKIDGGEVQTLAFWGITEISLTYSNDESLIFADGTVVHGLMEITKDGVTSEGAADVAFGWNQFGVQITEANGTTTYNFEVEEHHTYIADGVRPLPANDNNRNERAA